MSKIDIENQQVFANDDVAEPFQPAPTWERWRQQELWQNREGTVVRTGLYLRDRKEIADTFTEIEDEISKAGKVKSVNGKVGEVTLSSSDILMSNGKTIEESVIEQVQSNWEETDEASKAFIKNKPTIPDQVQANWNETNSANKSFIQNKPDIPDAQVQSDYAETDDTKASFIKNKPVIPNAQVNSDWLAEAGSISNIENQPFVYLTAPFINDGGNLTLKLEPNTLKINSNNELEVIDNQIKLHDAVDETTDEAITPKAVREVLFADTNQGQIQIGEGASTNGNKSTAIGSNAKVIGDFSVALGDYAEATAVTATAIGNGAKAKFGNSVAIGANSEATKQRAVAVNFGGLTRAIEGVSDPVSPQEAMTKNYADGHYMSLTQPQTVSGDITFTGAITFSGAHSSPTDIPWTDLTGTTVGAKFKRVGSNIAIKLNITAATSGDMVLGTLPLTQIVSDTMYFTVPISVSAPDKNIHLRIIGSSSATNKGRVDLLQLNNNDKISTQVCYEL